MYETANVRTTFDGYRKILFTYIKFMTIIITWIQIHNKHAVPFLLPTSYSIRLPSTLHVFVSLVVIFLNQLKQIFLRYWKIKNALFKKLFYYTGITLNNSKALEHYAVPRNSWVRK